MNRNSQLCKAPEEVVRRFLVIKLKGALCDLSGETLEVWKV
jgi:hypothetical protein